MLFQQLKKNFLEMEQDEQLEFIIKYTEKRQVELSSTTVQFDETKAKKSPAKKDKQIKLTSEQIKLLKQLGLV